MVNRCGLASHKHLDMSGFVLGATKQSLLVVCAHSILAMYQSVSVMGHALVELFNFASMLQDVHFKLVTVTLHSILLVICISFGGIAYNEV